MKIEQVAVQLYTLRDHLTTRAAYQETLQRVADIGYRSVQVAGPRPISEEEIAALCAEKGLVINSCHEDPVRILEDPARVVETLEAFGCRYATYPFPKDVDVRDAGALDALVRALNRSGEVLWKAGKSLAYHNHAIELELLEGIPILEIIYGGTDPRHLQGEIDTYWVHAGGSSPAAWCARLRDRLPLLHLKDYREEEGQAVFAEVGSGELDWPTIVATADACGCQWFMVEQDVCPGDPFVSLEKSFRYIYDHLL